MGNATFPQNGLSVESAVVIKAAYEADSHRIVITVNGSPFESCSKPTRKVLAAQAIDVLLELESSLLHQYNAEPTEVECLMIAARRSLSNF